ncbi:unnamed protein product, partial [Mycena citricolor]
MSPHLHDELQDSPRVRLDTQYGPITGARAANGSAVFLEVPYAQPPARFQDAQPLPSGYRYADREYTTESAYAIQPHNDGQAR